MPQKTPHVRGNMEKFVTKTPAGADPSTHVNVPLSLSDTLQDEPQTAAQMDLPLSRDLFQQTLNNALSPLAQNLQEIKQDLRHIGHRVDG